MIVRKIVLAVLLSVGSWATAQQASTKTVDTVKDSPVTGYAVADTGLTSLIEKAGTGGMQLTALGESNKEGDPIQVTLIQFNPNDTNLYSFDINTTPRTPGPKVTGAQIVSVQYPSSLDGPFPSIWWFEGAESSQFVTITRITALTPSAPEPTNLGYWQIVELNQWTIDPVLAAALKSQVVKAGLEGTPIQLLDPATLSPNKINAYLMSQVGSASDVLVSAATIPPGNYLFTATKGKFSKLDSTTMFPVTVSTTGQGGVSGAITLPTAFAINSQGSWAAYPNGTPLSWKGGDAVVSLQQSQLYLTPSSGQSIIDLWKGLPFPASSSEKGTTRVNATLSGAAFSASLTVGPLSGTFTELQLGGPAVAISPAPQWTGTTTIYSSSGGTAAAQIVAGGTLVPVETLVPVDMTAVSLIAAATSQPIVIAQGAPVVANQPFPTGFLLSVFANGSLGSPQTVVIGAPGVSSGGTLVDQNGASVQGAAAASGSITMPFNAWKSLVSGAIYAVFPGATTSGAEIIAYQAPSSSSFEGSFTASQKTISLSTQSTVPQATQTLTPSGSASPSVTLTPSGGLWQMSVADWDTVTRVGGTWGNQAGMFTFTANPIGSITSANSPWGSFVFEESLIVQILPTVGTLPTQAGWTVYVNDGGPLIQASSFTCTNPAGPGMLEFSGQAMQSMRNVPQGQVQVQFNLDASYAVIWQADWDGASLKNATIQTYIVVIDDLAVANNISVTEISATGPPLQTASIAGSVSPFGSGSTKLMIGVGGVSSIINTWNTVLSWGQSSPVLLEIAGYPVNLSTANGGVEMSGGIAQIPIYLQGDQPNLPCENYPCTGSFSFSQMDQGSFIKQGANVYLQAQGNLFESIKTLSIGGTVSVNNGNNQFNLLKTNPTSPWGNLSISVQQKWMTFAIQGSNPCSSTTCSMTMSRGLDSSGNPITVDVQVDGRANQAHILFTDFINQVNAHPDSWWGGQRLGSGTQTSPMGYTMTYSAPPNVGAMLNFTEYNPENQNCMGLFKDTNFQIQSWYCNNSQQAFADDSYGKPCTMYQCERAGFTRISGADAACNMYDGLQFSGNHGSIYPCFVVRCADYGGWNGKSNYDNCSPGGLSRPSPDNGLCLWCPHDVLLWAGSGYGCGVAPFMPSVHGFDPNGDSGGGLKCTSPSNTSPPLPWSSPYNYQP